MLNNCLFPMICEYQKRTANTFDQIYAVFQKLNIYYSRRLDYDDALQDMDVFLVELLFKVPLSKFCPDESFALQRYISASIRNHYILLSKQKSKRENSCVEYLDNLVSDTSFEDELELTLALDSLNNKQKFIIYQRYIYNYSDDQISKSLGITRQAVNRTKNRALKALRAYYKNT